MSPHTVPVSVVIPVRNGAGLIAEAINSVKNQTAAPREIIVIDADSSDDTEAVVRRFENVTFHRHARPGAAEQRNAGAGLASMPYLAFLDADDLWPEQRLERQLALFAQRPELDLVTGSLQQFRLDASGEIRLLWPPAQSHLPAVALMRTEAFFRVGPFSAEWKVGETVEWWSRAVDAGLRSEAVPHTVLMRRIHAGNMGKTVTSQAYLDMLHAVVKRRRLQGP